MHTWKWSWKIIFSARASDFQSIIPLRILPFSFNISKRYLLPPIHPDPARPCRAIQGKQQGRSVVRSSSLVTLSCVNVLTCLNAQKRQKIPYWHHSTVTYSWPSTSPAVWHSSACESDSGRGRTRGNLGSGCHFHKPQSCTFITAVFLTLPAWVSNCSTLQLPEMHFVMFPFSSQSSVGLTLSGTCPSIRGEW